MKKGDFITIVIIIVLAFLAAVLVFFCTEQGTKVIIFRDNKQIGKYSLKEQQTIEIGTNTIVIENGMVWVSYASCKNQICVHHKPISKKGESIICLPNKMIVEIVN